MTTTAGIAAVTAVLKDVLLNGLVDHDASSMVGQVMVTAQAPDRIALPEQNSQLNLFLYLVTPNSGWRNVGLPARNADGDLVSAPPLALDLHYLLSAYGTKDLHAEILLGYAMQLFHEMPVLTREAIRLAFSPGLNVNGAAGPMGKIPIELQDLFHSGLADQIEQIKITPSYLNTEEMFKLWMAFQAPYRPTAAYHVSVVLIDGKRQGKTPPPVRQFAIVASPSAPPIIEQLCSQAAPDQPFRPQQRVLAHHRLALIGKGLRGESTRVIVDDHEIVVPEPDVTDTRIEFPLPAGVTPGVRSVRVVHLMDLSVPPAPPALHRGFESNVVALVLCPELSNVQIDITAGDGAAPEVPRAGQLSFNIAPAVGKHQRIVVLLNELAPPDTRSAFGHRLECQSHRQPDSPETSSSLTVPLTGLHKARYLLRAQVDGAESPLDIDGTGKLASPQVNVT